MQPRPNLPPPHYPLNKATNQPRKSSSNWLMSYRIQGLALGLAAAGLYCYFYLGYWSKFFLIACGILGYFLGSVVGYFMCRVK
jgi:hypothetical protein